MSRTTTRRTRSALALLTAAAVLPALALLPSAPAVAAGKKAGYAKSADVLQLPADFSPEGIAAGPGTSFFAGSRPGPQGGAVYRGDLLTGEGSVVVSAQPGGASIGMTYDPTRGVLWVAGGGTDAVTAYAPDGRLVKRYVVPEGPGDAPRFLNDVDVTDDGVFVTDSRNAELVVVRTPDGGPLPEAAETLPLTGEWSQSAEGNNANGIRALVGGDLLVVDQGELLRVDAQTGVADRLTQTGGRDLTGGDGLELEDGRLYVVYGFAEDSVAVVDLDLAGSSYAVTGVLTKTAPAKDDLERPTTALAALGSLYVVNGKFGTTTTDQEVVRLPLP